MDIPIQCKAVKPFIKRAEELEGDPSKELNLIIAHYCRMYAIEVVMPLTKTDPSGNTMKFALELMNKLEEDRKGPAGAISTKEEGKEIVNNFALAVFKRADDEDRAGASTRATARKFYCAANFLTTLNQFGPLEPKIEELLKYATWKAADIERAIKNGLTPVPGPPGGFPEEEKKDSFVAPSNITSNNPFGLPDVPPNVVKVTDFVKPDFVKPTIPKISSFRETDLEREARELASKLADADAHSHEPKKYKDDDEEEKSNYVKPPSKPTYKPSNPPPTNPSAPPPNNLNNKNVNQFVQPVVFPPTATVIVPPSKLIHTMPKTAVEDATELTRFALRALDSKLPNPELAIERLEEALSILKTKYAHK